MVEKLQKTWLCHAWVSSTMPKFTKKLAIQFQENAQTDGRIEGLKGGPEVINIQRPEAELNIILLRVNNFDIKQKKSMEYLVYYMPPMPNKTWEDKG